MNIEKLQQDIEALKTQKEELIKNANLQVAQIEGAIQYAVTKLDELIELNNTNKTNTSPNFEGLVPEKAIKVRKTRTKKVKTEE